MKQEFKVEVERGELSLAETDYTTKEVTVLIGVTGDLEGTVLFGTTEEMAMNIVYELTGERKVFYDDTCESAIAELGNVISGRATALFEDQGIKCTISPPTVISGRGTIISAVNMRRLIVPLHTGWATWTSPSACGNACRRRRRDGPGAAGARVRCSHPRPAGTGRGAPAAGGMRPARPATGPGAPKA